MVDVGLDLLDGISSGAPVYHNINASQYESIDNNQYFAQHFWVRSLKKVMFVVFSLTVLS